MSLLLCFSSPPTSVPPSICTWMERSISGVAPSLSLANFLLLSTPCYPGHDVPSVWLFHRRDSSHASPHPALHYRSLFSSSLLSFSQSQAYLSPGKHSLPLPRNGHLCYPLCFGETGATFTKYLSQHTYTASREHTKSVLFCHQ